jgi:hypothetical protein
MRFAVLGSGSRGNATLIETNGTRVLLDCGFGLRDVEMRLLGLDVRARDLTAILVTHEHGDHVAGVARLARRHGLEVWASPGTWKGAHAPEVGRLRLFPGHARSVRIDGLVLRPIPVPHDAREPCQFAFEADGRRLGVLTDAGTVTPRMCDALRECDALMLEANHDPEHAARRTLPTERAAARRRALRTPEQRAGRAPVRSESATAACTGCCSAQSAHLQSSRSRASVRAERPRTGPLYRLAGGLSRRSRLVPASGSIVRPRVQRASAARDVSRVGARPGGYRAACRTPSGCSRRSGAPPPPRPRRSCRAE